MRRWLWYAWLVCPPWRTAEKLTAEIERMEAELAGVYQEAVADSLVRHWPKFWAYWRQHMWGKD